MTTTNITPAEAKAHAIFKAKHAVTIVRFTLDDARAEVERIDMTEAALRNGLARLIDGSEIAIPRDEIRGMENMIDMIVDDPESWVEEAADLAKYLGVTL
jgi:hypothetical protein